MRRRNRLYKKVSKTFMCHLSSGLELSVQVKCSRPFQKHAIEALVPKESHITKAAGKDHPHILPILLYKTGKEPMARPDRISGQRCAGLKHVKRIPRQR